MNRSRLIAIAGIVLVLAAGFWFWKGRGKKDAPKFRTVAVEQGDLTSSVSATGSVRPVVQVEVGSQVSGTLDKLYVDYNSHVRAGQVLGQLEPSVFRARLAQAEASVARAEAALKDANRQYARAKELVRDDFVSQADVDAAEVQVDQRRADLKQAKAQYDAAAADLAHATIRSPIDGVVIARSIDVGQTVAASLQAPKLFVIANDLKQMQVETKIDEADIGRIKVGLPVTFTVDAFPDETFEGKVSQVRLEPITEQNVVTYTTVIATRNDQLSLRPGMTANVTVLVESKQDVMKVPNAALRFRPGGAGGMNGMGGRGGMGGSGGPGGSGGGMGGGMRRSFAALLSKVVPPAFAQDGPPAGMNGPGMNDPYVQQIREKVRNGELSREEARELIRKHFAEKGIEVPQRGLGGGGPGSGGGPGMRGGEGGPGMRGGEGAAARGGAAGEAGAMREMRGGGAGRDSARMGGMGGRGGWGGGKSRGGFKPGSVFVLENGKPRMIRVMTGITDGSMTEVKSDSLKAGDMVIVGTEMPASRGASGLQPPPGMGGPQFGRPGGTGGGRR